MSHISTFSCRTEVIFGEGSVQKLSGVLTSQQFTKLAVICDEGVRNAGLLDDVLAQIEVDGASYSIFSDVEPNPSSRTVQKGQRFLSDSGADAIIAVGGGSPLDTAKAVAVVATNPGDISQYEGVDQFVNEPIPLIAIPTTSGTGSEVTNNTVITDLDRQYKFTVISRKLSPRWAIVDPLLTLTLPRHLTASTGLDALVHAIESYLSTASTPLTEALALEAIRVISGNLRQAVYNGDNRKARTDMLYGSLVAGLAFNHTRLGNVHAMSHPLSAMYQVPHGIANSILLPHVMEFNRLAVPEKFVQIAKAMGEVNDESKSMLELSKESVKAVQRLAADIGIPETFEEFNVREESLLPMAKDAMKSGNILVNPRKTTIKDILDLYRKTLGRVHNEQPVV
ncbi:iron-containing alcohol dehydrogenase [Fictibacillus enclensis]|uniref:iron-containing alcohol dehydrogenase n=1 Tax=Fictibacillus enclensis TaxID=1017270 RepID=UPI0025A20AEC|nr:iron-containing alcohol dehydrogenase [Fictibacillus enclensis]MDM5338550.1 iron-containing alcohol dehydrogenase [Fictibacillus enclensis]